MADEHGVKATIDVDGESYIVTSAVIEEKLDAIPSLEVRLERDGALPKPSSLLGKDAKLAIGRVDLFDAPRKFQGIVVVAERRADAEGHPYLRLVVMPKLFKLGKRTDCRTFQQKTAGDILKDVVEGAGAGPVRMQLSGSHETREWVVQYRETDLDFLLRLAAEAGIAMAFDHESGEVVFFDDPHGLGDAEDATVKYFPEFGFDQAFVSVSKLSEAHAVTTDKVMFRDYDFERPRFKLESTVEGTDDGVHALELYLFPARTSDESALKARAQTLLDALQCRRDVVSGVTSAWKLSPGQRFTVEAHPYAPLDTELLVTGTRFEFEESRTSFGGGGRHRAKLSFEAMPTGKSAYRPARRDAATRVAGVQTAVTTGASGQEIHVDDAGRVNILYPWDRLGKKDETSSLPVRTLQLATGGSMLLPRVGWEVLVHCTDGDQDLPLVTGRLYNAERPPPYALPGGKARSSIQTATTPGGGSANEIRTDDTAGKEEMFFNASKDTTILVKNNTTESIGNNATLAIGGDQKVNVTNSAELAIGASQTVTVGGNQKISVETVRVDDCGGDHTLDVGGNRDMKVGGDHKHTVAGGETVDVGSMKTDLVVGSVSEQTGGSMTLDVGAVRATLTAGNHVTTVGASHDETCGAARVNIVFGTKSSDIGASQNVQIGGGQINLVKGDRNEIAGATLTDLAGGAHIIKANNVNFEADGAITLVMGASILSITPATVAILGVSVKLDGATTDTAALVIDN